MTIGVVDSTVIIHVFRKNPLKDMRVLLAETLVIKPY